MFYRKIYCDFLRRSTLAKELLSCKSLVSKARANTNRHTKDRDLVSAAFQSYKINSVQDWTDVRESILKHKFNRGQFTTHNIDSMIVGHCSKTKQYSLGDSYISFLSRSNIKPNLATVGRYLKLIYSKNCDKWLEGGGVLDKSEETLIFKYYKDLRNEYPVLDSFTLESVTLALSLTSRWKECLDLVKEIKISANPSASVYSAVIAACFLHNRDELSWKLLDEMLGHEKVPTSVAFLAYVKALSRLKDKGLVGKKLEKLFKLFQEHHLKCSEVVANSISVLGNVQGFQSDFTTVGFNGVCKNCYQKLEAMELTDEEFVQLRKKVLDNVIVGRDVFVKTNPEELQRFKKFIANMERHDVVLDGLNVAYSVGTKQSPHVFSSLVSSVVSHFVQQRKKVLVLGRQHMRRWPHRNWSYVEQNATVFLAQDISQDDPYLLYCALTSGKDTLIVTRDLMRGHRFLLRDPKLKLLFDLWLSQRQYQLIRVDEKQGPVFRKPLPYDVVAQASQRIWHIPYEPKELKNENEYHQTWLCVKN